jgi:energy-converting hydrogenase Eha subunit A
MRESPLGFEYTWADLQPIRALAITVFASQLVGAALGLGFAPHEHWFHRLWFGGAVATFPSFLVGLFIQARLQTGSVGENRVMVRRLGLIAAVLSLVALFMEELGLD